jgi:hypothetical protein
VAVERSQGARRPRRPVFLALVVVGLLGLVALAARTHPPAGGGAGSSRHVPGDRILEYILLLLVAEAIVVLPFMGYVFWTGRLFRAQQRRKQNWMKRLFIVMAAASIFLAVALGWRATHGGGGSGSGGRPRITTLPPPPPAGAQHSATVGFDWVPAVVVGSLLLFGIAVALVALRSSERSRRKSPEALAEQLSDVLDDTLDDLRAEPDPRRAVIAAYARMERALAWFGLPRRVFEAPLEYLSRVLLELKASTESVRRLTSLFERAKFSAHEIAPGLKEDAIEALVAVRDELRAYR